MGWFSSEKDKGKLKALIISDNIKEFIGAVAPLVDEASLEVTSTGITIKAVEPEMVWMIESTLTSAAFAKFEAEETKLKHIGKIDVDKFKSVIAVAKPKEMIGIERDTEMNSLVVTIGNQVEVVPLLTAADDEIVDVHMPPLDFPAMVKVKAEEITQKLETSKNASAIELATNKESFKLNLFRTNIYRDSPTNINMNRAQLEELKVLNETASSFSLKYFSLMVNSVEKDRILTISLGNDFPVKIEADLAVDERLGATSPQGSVFFLLSPLIDPPENLLAIERAKEREEALDYDVAIRIWEEIGYTEEATRVRRLKVEQSAVKVDQTVVHGDYVDDRDTIVKDSVINRSNIGGGSSKMQELEKLTEMKKEGLIDDDEFKQMKKEILGK